MTPDDARALAVSLARPRPPERVPVLDAAGRVLAGAARAPRSLPGEPRSRLDGWALCAEATAGAPVTLSKAPGALTAGHAPALPLAPGRCIRIFTGAPLPVGADAVLAEEEAGERDGLLFVPRALRSGQGVMPAGAEVRRGEMVGVAGDIVSGSLATALGLAGIGGVWVFGRPRVAVLATGDELREAEELADDPPGPLTPPGGRDAVRVLSCLQGAQAWSLGIAGDDPAVIADRLSGVEADLVVTTGGTGRGARDCIRAAWARLGVKPLFTELFMTPGSGTALGVLGGRVFLALPGGPLGARVAFFEVGVPILRAAQGLSGAAALPPSLVAPLARGCSNLTKGHRAVTGRLTLPPPLFTPLAKGPGLATLHEGGSWFLLPPGAGETPAGTHVSVRLPDAGLSAGLPSGAP